MNFRNRAFAGIVVTAVLATGCAGSVAGQPEVAATALVPAVSTVSRASPATAPTPAAESPTDQTSSPASTSSRRETDERTADATTTARLTTGTGPPATTGSRGSVGPTSIPGLSADCNKVLAAITAFTSVLQGIAGGTSGDTISQADVDDALQQLPTSGLPARPQADVNILRATIKSAAGKTITGLALSLSDGKVVDALQDLSSWATVNCG